MASQLFFSSYAKCGKIETVSQGKGSQIQITKKLSNSVLVGHGELLRPRFVLFASAFGFGS